LIPALKAAVTSLKSAINARKKETEREISIAQSRDFKTAQVNAAKQVPKKKGSAITSISAVSIFNTLAKAATSELVPAFSEADFLKLKGQGAIDFTTPFGIMMPGLAQAARNDKHFSDSLGTFVRKFEKSPHSESAGRGQSVVPIGGSGYLAKVLSKAVESSDEGSAALMKRSMGSKFDTVVQAKLFQPYFYAMSETMEFIGAAIASYRAQLEGTRLVVAIYMPLAAQLLQPADAAAAAALTSDDLFNAIRQG
jgi:hypothetical protein